MLVISKLIDNWRADNMKADQVQTESFPLFDRQACVDVILRNNNSIRVQPQRIGALIGSAMLKPKINPVDLRNYLDC